MSKVSSCLRSKPELLLPRLVLLFGQFVEVLNERGFRDVSAILRQLWRDLSSLDPETWETLLHDSTSPIPRATTLDETLLDKGLGPMGKVKIPQEVWDSLVPKAFGHHSRSDALKNKPLSTHALKMLRAIARDNPSVFRASDGGKGPNCWAFVIPKNAIKASFIFHLVELNAKDPCKPPSFTLPTLEELAYLMQCLVGGGGITRFCKALIGAKDLKLFMPLI